MVEAENPERKQGSVCFLLYSYWQPLLLAPVRRSSFGRFQAAPKQTQLALLTGHTTIACSIIRSPVLNNTARGLFTFSTWSEYKIITPFQKHIGYF